MVDRWQILKDAAERLGQGNFDLDSEQISNGAHRIACYPGDLYEEHRWLFGHVQKTSSTHRPWWLKHMLRPLHPQALAYVVSKGKYSTLHKQDECYVSQRDGDLGVFLRWLVILQLVANRIDLLDPEGGPIDEDALGQLATTRVLQQFLTGDKDERARRAWAKAMHYSVEGHWARATNYCRDDILPERFFKVVCAIRALRRAPPPLSPAQLLEIPVAHRGEALGVGMLGRYAVWLEHGWLPARDDLTRLHAEIFFAGELRAKSARRKQLDDVLHALLEDAEVTEQSLSLSDSHPVLSIYSPKNWHGTRAFATQLVIELKEKLPRANKPYGLIYVPLSRGIAKSKQLQTRADVIRLLERALLFDESAADGDMSNGLGAIASDSADELSRLTPLRRMLTKRPTLVIFDGLELSSRPFSALFEILKHADWPTFIKTLAQPDLLTMRSDEGAGRYPSRFIVLSGQQIESLRDWLPGPPVLLAPPDDPRAAAKLIRPGGHAEVSTWYEGIERRCVALWDKAERPDTSEQELRLPRLYPLNDATVDAIEQSGDPPLLPDELDLVALACEQGMGSPKWPPPASAATGSEAAIRRLDVFRRYLDPERTSVGDRLALHLVAASLRGLRVSALRRCLRAYVAAMANVLDAAEVELIHATSEELQRDFGEALGERFRTLVVRVDDESVEGVGELQRWFEMQSQDANADSREAANTATLLDVRFVELREVLLADMFNAPPAFTSEEQQRHRRHFETVHRVLAEDSIAEATAQLRVMRQRVMTAYTVRRFVQTAYHGLMSLSYESDWRSSSEGGHAESAGGVLGSYLPADPYKCYVFLYQHVFRRCIDNAPEWFLGRGIGRHDVRLALLAMFASPGWARRVLASMYRRPLDQRGYVDFGAFLGSKAAATGTAFRDPFSVYAPYLAGPLGVDLFQALLHSAARTSEEHRRFVANWAESIGKYLLRRRSRLPVGEDTSDSNTGDVTPVEGLAQSAIAAILALSSSQTGRPKPQTSDVDPTFAFGKLAIDSRQALMDLKKTEATCLDWLRRMHGPLPEQLLTLGMRLSPLLDKAAFEREQLQPIVASIIEANSSARALERIADIFSRLGELLAASTDKENEGDLLAAARKYANAYAVYWIGDRVRSSAALAPVGEGEWPTVSARAFRYYVRVSLKIAKLAAKVSAQTICDLEREPDERQLEASRLAASSQAFFAHAMGRIDVYSRHLYRLPAEQLAMQLLLASAARVRGSIARLIEPHAPEAAPRYLRASIDYLVAAENVLVGLGYQDAMALRLLFERHKTLKRLVASEDGRPSSAYDERIAQRDLVILEKLADNHPAWKQRVKGVRRADGKSQAADQ